MPRRSHRKLFDNQALVLKGLRTDSIPEPAVDVWLNGKLKGKFQGLEVFDKFNDENRYPQTVADLVSNAYFRLTYQNSQKATATFGTSLVGCCSMATSDKVFHLIPQMKKAMVSIGEPHRLKIELFGFYEDFAELCSVRSYSICPKQHLTVMTLENSLKILKEVTLDSSRIRNNALRLFSISSMYSGKEYYDGNLLTWSSSSKNFRLDLRDSDSRNKYLLEKPEVSSNFSLVKQEGSKGEKNSPGSPDSPSINVKLLESSLPIDEIGVQGYLDPSQDPNDDSLSIWAEWINPPTILKTGLNISFKAEFSAFPEHFG